MNSLSLNWKKKRSVSEWHSPQGVIGIYRRRYSNKKGKIEFYINSNKDLQRQWLHEFL